MADCKYRILLLLAPLAVAPLCAAQSAPTPTPPAAKPAAVRADTAPTWDQRRQAEKYFLEGAKAIDRGDVKDAERDFVKAAEMDPSNPRYAASAEIARENQVTELVQDADKAHLLGNEMLARQDIAAAYKIDPKNPVVAEHQDELDADQADSATMLPDVTSKELAPPIQIAPVKALKSFHLHVDSKQLLQQVLGAYGVQASIDGSVRSELVRFDVDNVDYARAAELLKLVTKTFFVPLDPARVLVAEDTKENRNNYERQVMETVYLPGLTPTEMSDMGNVARNLFEAEKATVQTAHSSITVRAPQSRINALNATLEELLDGRAQVQFDLRLYEIDRTRLVDLGVVLPTETTIFNVPSELNSFLQNNASLVQQIISGGLASPNDYAAIAAILIASGQAGSSILSQPFATFGGGLTLSGLVLNGGNLNLQLNTSDVRALDQVTIRSLDQEESTIRSGTHYPIITNTYSSLSGSTLGLSGISTPGLSSQLQGLGLNLASLESAAAQTIPQVQYTDLGLTLKVKPRVQQTRDVSVSLDLQITALEGASLNNIPVLNNRHYQSIITLRPGETAVLISALSRTESLAVSGIPGLSEIPGFQSFTNKQTNLDTSNLVIVVTPHIVRMAHQLPAGRMVMLPQHP